MKLVRSEGAALTNGSTTPAAKGTTQHEFIERRNERGLVDRRLALATVFADARLLAAAEAFVGTSRSWTSRLLLLAVTSGRSAPPPYIFLDQGLGAHFWRT